MRGAMTHLMAAVVAVALAAGCKSSGGGGGDTKGTSGSGNPGVKVLGNGFKAAVSGEGMAKEGAKLIFENRTNAFLTFFVDGDKIMGIRPGADGTTYVSPGKHHLCAKDDSGRKTEGDYEISSNGGAWTISED